MVVDSHLDYPGGKIDLAAIRALGPELLDIALARDGNARAYDPQMLAEVLMSMV